MKKPPLFLPGLEQGRIPGFFIAQILPPEASGISTPAPVQSFLEISSFMISLVPP